MSNDAIVVVAGIGGVSALVILPLLKRHNITCHKKLHQAALIFLLLMPPGLAAVVFYGVL